MNLFCHHYYVSDIRISNILAAVPQSTKKKTVEKPKQFNSKHQISLFSIFISCLLFSGTKKLLCFLYAAINLLTTYSSTKQYSFYRFFLFLLGKFQLQSCNRHKPMFFVYIRSGEFTGKKSISYQKFSYNLSKWNKDNIKTHRRIYIDIRKLRYYHRHHQ